MRKLLLFGILSLVMAQVNCAKPPEPQQECGFVQNSEGQRVSWKGIRPIVLYFDVSVPQQYHDVIQRAAQQWERVLGQSIFKFGGVISSSQPAQDGKSVIYWLPYWDANISQQQANTTIYWADSQLTEADIKVNAANFAFSTNLESATVDVESLLVHELGHVLGLKHEEGGGSVMAKSLPSSYDRREVQAIDSTHLKCEY